MEDDITYEARFRAHIIESGTADDIIAHQNNMFDEGLHVITDNSATQVGQNARKSIEDIMTPMDAVINTKGGGGPLSARWKIDIEIKINDDPEIWEVKALELEFDEPVSQQEAYWKFERIMSNDDVPSGDYVGSAVYGDKPAKTKANSRVNLDEPSDSWESELIRGSPTGVASESADDILDKAVHWPYSKKKIAKIEEDYDLEPGDIQKIRDLVGIGTKESGQGYRKFRSERANYGKSGADLDEWYSHKASLFERLKNKFKVGRFFSKDQKSPAVDKFIKSFRSKDEADKFFYEKALPIVSRFWSSGPVLLSSDSSKRNVITLQSTEKRLIGDSVGQYNASIHDINEYSISYQEMNLSMFGMYMDQIYHMKSDTISSSDPIGSLKFYLVNVLKSKLGEISNQIYDYGKTELDSDVINVPHFLSDFDGATSAYNNSRMNITVLRSDQTVFDINGNSFSFELIFDIDLTSVWIFNGTEYINKELFFDGSWNPELFLSYDEMLTSSSNIQTLIDTGMLPRFDFKDKSSDLHLLASSFYLENIRMQELAIDVLADPILSEDFDYFEMIVLSLSDISLENLISEYRRIEYEKIVNGFTNIIVDNSGVFPVNMTMSEFILGLETALFKDGFSSASPWQQGIASDELISNIQSDILKSQTNINTDRIRDRVYTNDIGSLIFNPNTPINSRFSDYFSNDYNLYDLSFDSLTNLLQTKTQPWIVDNDIPGDRVMSKLQSFYGRQKTMTVEVRQIGNSLLTLYRKYKESYDELGLVSESAGFFKALDNAINWKFDWRFVDWGRRNKAGDIPMISQWAFDLLLKLNFADPYTLLLLEPLLTKL